MKKSKKMGNLSIYEASEFWDEHNFTEFEDIKEVKGISFSLSKKKYIGVDMDLYTKIRNRARSLDKTEDLLINEWLREKVR
jgi:hypothetical protein